MVTENDPIHPMEGNPGQEPPAEADGESPANAPVNAFCPHCDMPLSEGAVVCVSCGFNQETGELIGGDSAAPRPEGSLLLRVGYAVLDCMPGLFHPVPLIGFVVCMAVAVGVALLGVMVLALGALLSGIAIGTAALAVYAQGVAFLFSGRIEMLKTAVEDFEGLQLQVFVAVALAPALAWFLWLGIVA